MTQATILAIDDDSAFLDLIRLFLSQHGFRVITATSGIDGLEQALVERPDLIILDIMMPDIDGYEVCRRLRAEPATAETPILMLTAKSHLEDKIEGFRAGTDDYLSKPVELAELLARVQAILGRVQRTMIAPGRIVVFWGAKGGIGVSTLAASVAVVLAQQGDRPVLLDLHPGFGDSQLHFGLQPGNSLATLLKEEEPTLTYASVAQSLVTHSSGLRLLVGGMTPEVSPRLTPELTSVILDALRRSGDPVIVDLPAGFYPFTLGTLLAASQVILVTEGRPVAVRDAEHRISWLLSRGLQAEEIGLVLVNRDRATIVVTAQEMRERFAVPFLAVVPPAPEATYAAEKAGYPVILHPQDTGLEYSIQTIVARIRREAPPGLGPEKPAADTPLTLPRRRRGL